MPDQDVITPPAPREQIAFEPFGAIEPGKSFRILPIGEFYRGTRKLGIDDARAREIVHNFENGLPRFGIPINVEHGNDPHHPGKIGRVTGLRYIPGDGVYVNGAEWTEVGNRLLSEERFDAPSPEMIWTLNDNARYQDPETGAWHDNVMVGLALTTAPFFGRHVSVFSVFSGGNLMEGQTPTGASNPLADMLQKMQAALDAILAKLSAKQEDAAAKLAEPPAPPKPEDEQKPKPAPMMASAPIQPEAFAELKRQAALVETMKAQLELAQTNSTRLAEEFAAERQLRLQSEFTARAEEFAALPAKTDELAAHLLWLNQNDATQGKPHFEFFSTLLTASNRALGQSALFSQFSSAHASSDTAADQHPFLAAVERIRIERFKTDSYAKGFANAYRAAESEHKDLAQQFAMERRHGALQASR